ncbi:MAG: zinc-ribbon domain-containing protein, partial [Gammaproteobacteria bacterium]|nr:zinc-ribbon domain-containing protein [Gammaproteobacteria bacterium]
MAEDEVDPLVTECPSCQTRFRVTENQLQAAAGRVRCGACLTVFQGVEHLQWDDEPQFENDKEADSALDDLLNELGDGAPDNHKGVDEPGSAALPDLDAIGDDALSLPQVEEEWSEPGHQLYGGHEDPTDLDREELERIEQTLLGVSENADPGADEQDDEAEIEELVLDQVAEQPPAEGADPLAESANPLDDLQTDEPDAWDQPDEWSGSEVTSEEPPEVERDEPPAWEPPENVPAAEPFTFGEEPKPRRWWMLIATVGALLALVVQVLWYQYDAWSRDPDLRPLYGVICKAMGCELPVMRDIDSMLAQNLVVRSHPEVANALLVDAIIINQATFVQPFPV